MLKFSALLSIVLVCTYVSFAKDVKDTKDKLERLMEFYVNNDDFSGAVLIAKKGNVLLSKGYGYRNVEKKTENTENTIFQIGSNTKQFTAEAILQLDSKARLGLEDRVSKYLPDFPNGDKITLKNLLTHTSGLYDYTRDTIVSGAHSDRPMKKEDILKLFENKPLSFEPGKKFEYCNSNYFLLGCIIEQISKIKYESEIKRSILHTCGMTHSGFDFKDLKDQNKATGYYFAGKDYAKEAPVTDSSVAYAAGALYSTTGDMYKWYRTLTSYRLLPKDWQDLAFTPNKNNYALGWEIGSMFQKRFIEHSGGISGFASYELIQKEDDVYIILLSNNMQMGENIEAMAKNIAKCLYDNDFKMPVAKKAVILNPDILNAYAGEYTFTPNFSITASIDGSALTAQATSQEPYVLVAENLTSFFIPGIKDARIRFVKDLKGNVTKMVLHQNGREITGTKR